MEIDEGNRENDLGLSGPSILEEYQLQLQEQKRELQEKQNQVRQLQHDYEQLMESSHRDTKSLESKEQEIERLKRSVAKLQKENVEIRNAQRRGTNIAPPSGSTSIRNSNQGITTQPPPVPTFQAAAAARKSALEKKKLAEQGEELLSRELDYNIQHFNEQFIENLSQSLSQMLVKKPLQNNGAASEANPKNADIEITETQEANEEDEDDDNDEDDEIEIPKDERSQQEVIESNEEIKREDQQIRENLVQT